MLLLSGVPAAAQDAAPPTEHVTVTGIKDVEAAVTKFVGNRTVATRIAGKLARWRQGVCPLVAGLRPEAVKLITQRVKEVAAQVGAPVNDRESCKPNIEIVFTTTPQVLMDNVTILYPFALGYHDNSAQAAQMAKVVWPVQAWYSTATDDLRGNVQVDGAKPPAGGTVLNMPAPPPIQNGIDGMAGTTLAMNMPDAHIVNVTGGRLNDGVSSDFYHIAIVAEPAKLLDYQIGTLADYIALMALSQTPPPEACEELPTILNLFAKGCDAPPKTLTGVDLAYLRALYKMTATANLRGQRDEVIYQMDKSLVSEK
ncbi:MAG TPA: hypothetical protein VFI23_08220 [Rhizomicrobium sp.]|nr:hypothetical protein [Rhizomicrobium sp.]